MYPGAGPPTAMLQWGRLVIEAESVRVGGEWWQGVGRASMGPPRDRGGERVAASGGRTAAKLQWGRLVIEAER